MPKPQPLNELPLNCNELMRLKWFGEDSITEVYKKYAGQRQKKHDGFRKRELICYA